MSNNNNNNNNININLTIQKINKFISLGYKQINEGNLKESSRNLNIGIGYLNTLMSEIGSTLKHSEYSESSESGDQSENT